MSPFDLLGIAVFVACFGAFVAVRRGIVPLVILLATILGAFLALVMLFPWRATPTEVLLVTAGLVLSAVGWILARLILIRSVSLRLLASEGRTPDAGEFRGLVLGRLEEGRKFRIVSCHGDRFRLSALGHGLTASLRLQRRLRGLGE